jgi:hypothetical protein
VLTESKAKEPDVDEYERRTKRCLFLMQQDKTQGISHELNFYMNVLEGKDQRS